VTTEVIGVVGHQAGEPEIEVLPDRAAVSRAAAARLAGALEEAVARRGRADWVTTGGSTPVGIYRQLAVAPLRNEVPWAEVHVWWGDDRFVPRDHPLSNVLPLDQVLLAAGASGGEQSELGGERLEMVPGVPLPAENVHAPRMGQAIAEGRGPEWVATAYEDELRAAGLPQGDPGIPIFDVVLVGVGPDGHVLSVFPRSDLFSSTAWASAVAAPTHVEPYVARVSLHPAILAVARLAIVVVHGHAKADIVGEILAGPRDPRRLPAQLARRAGAIWFLDRAAAARLPA
jgi:6-phosphogluconolactonase